MLRNFAIDERALDVKKVKVSKIIQNQKDTSLVTYQDSMRTIHKEFDLETNYFKKFGYLKKAAVLMRMGRENDAHTEVAHACKIIKVQKDIDLQRHEAIQKRWKFKLGIDEGFELPESLLKQHPDTIDYKKTEELDSQYPISTIKLYVEAVSPFTI